MSFAKKVLEVVRKIPRGKVMTYKQVAEKAGNPQAARAVGQILKRNPFPIRIPCHRVVKSNLEVGGYIFGRKNKIKLLRAEGIKICGNKVKIN